MKKTGYGYLIYQNGARFSGQFENGRIMGYGIYEYENTVIKGFWKNGKLIE